MLFLGSLAPSCRDEAADTENMYEGNGVSESAHNGRVAIVVISCVAIALGAGFGARSSAAAPVKSVAKSIKIADSFMKSAKVIHRLHSPSPLNLLFLTLAAVKAISKSASKGLIIKNHSAKFKQISKGLKASEGALNLVKYSSVLNCGAADPLEYVIKGYKLTKGAFNMFDGVNGAAARGYGALKGAMEGVSVAVKAVVLSKQMYGILIQSLGISHGAFRILLEEINNNKKKEDEDSIKTWRPLWQPRQRIRMRVSCLQSHNGVYEINFEKDLASKCLLVSSDDRAAHQSQGSDLDSIFSLSFPCPADNDERIFRYICSHK